MRRFQHGRHPFARFRIHVPVGGILGHCAGQYRNLAAGDLSRSCRYLVKDQREIIPLLHAHQVNAPIPARLRRQLVNDAIARGNVNLIGIAPLAMRLVKSLALNSRLCLNPTRLLHGARFLFCVRSRTWGSWRIVASLPLALDHWQSMSINFEYRCRQIGLVPRFYSPPGVWTAV